jgi:hypothetical protein
MSVGTTWRSGVTTTKCSIVNVRYRCRGAAARSRPR